MTIKVGIHLRKGDNATNIRARAIGVGLQELDRVRVKYLGRNERDQDSDLIIQVGLANTVCLTDAVMRRKPYLIMEAPHFRPDADAVLSNSSWGYNGLAGFGWHHLTPDISRPKPELAPRKDGGDVILFAQKPNDHSLNEHDHCEWVRRTLKKRPDAELRHHPLMCAEGQESITDALKRCGEAITFSSTAGVDALIAGCKSIPVSKGSMAHGVSNRGQWLHDLSWKQFSHREYNDPSIAGYVMAGFEEARARAFLGDQQHPREKGAKRLDMARYYQWFSNV